MSKILLFIPFYNCEKQIVRVLDKVKLYENFFHEILLIDNRSVDNGLEIVKEKIKILNLTNAKVVRNLKNYNLGGSHKVAFQYATQNDFSHLIVLHGDDQGTIEDIIPHLEQKTYLQYECLLGARFHPLSRLIGYSKFRTLGNIIVNSLCRLACKRKILDMGSGLNMYSRVFFQDSKINYFPNDLTFNVSLLFHSCFINSKILFFPISWKEEDQISNANVFSQFRKILNLILKSSLNSEVIYRDQKAQKYEYEII